jgi:DNA repair protein RadA/Sms
MVEELEQRDSRSRTRRPSLGSARPLKLHEIEGDGDERISLPIGEFARVLGGGIVPGSVILIGGDPGIGKSTLLLQMAVSLAGSESVLYVSGEESERQIKARAQRLMPDQEKSDELFVLTETNLDAVIAHVESLGPSVIVIDSVQTMFLPELESSAGSVSQVREVTSRLQTLAKGTGIAVFLVGHVTKEGAIAGPRVMEHIVDTVLYLEGDTYHAYRLLRSVKNRFGATTEVGVFEMRTEGMLEVPNPSEVFLAERVLSAPGSAVAVTMEGTRPLLVEIQGLTSRMTFGNPRRTANGVDFNRLLLTLAVLTRRANVRVDDLDVFVNVVGGMRIGEPAADLAVATAVASSIKDQPIAADTALIGELGLSGELRAVPQMGHRLQEAAKLGFKRVIVPKRIRSDGKVPVELKVQSIRTLREALGVLFESK